LPKSNFKIITLKLTNYTDILFLKIFFKSKEYFDEAASKIREGN